MIIGSFVRFGGNKDDLFETCWYYGKARYVLWTKGEREFVLLAGKEEYIAMVVTAEEYQKWDNYYQSHYHIHTVTEYIDRDKTISNSEYLKDWLK